MLRYATGVMFACRATDKWLDRINTACLAKLSEFWVNK